MLDTHAGKFIKPVISKAANLAIRIGLEADQITWLALSAGLSSSILVLAGFPVSGTTLLWISGLLDALDGTVARIDGSSSSWGTLMDITFDRIVETVMIIVLAFRSPSSRMSLVVLLSSIIFSMTVFLTVGALSQRDSEKSFYYQAGLAERTEGFILISLMVLFPACLRFFAILLSSMVLITGFQRMCEAYRLFHN